MPGAGSAWIHRSAFHGWAPDPYEQPECGCARSGFMLGQGLAGRALVFRVEISQPAHWLSFWVIVRRWYCHVGWPAPQHLVRAIGCVKVSARHLDVVGKAGWERVFRRCDVETAIPKLLAPFRRHAGGGEGA